MSHNYGKSKSMLASAIAQAFRGVRVAFESPNPASAFGHAVDIVREMGLDCLARWGPQTIWFPTGGCVQFCLHHDQLRGRHWDRIEPPWIDEAADVPGEPSGEEPK